LGNKTVEMVKQNRPFLNFVLVAVTKQLGQERADLA